MEQDTLLEYGTPQTTQTEEKQSYVIASNNRTIKTTFYSFVLLVFFTLIPFILFPLHPGVIPADHCPHFTLPALYLH